jgi:hypothetical protein
VSESLTHQLAVSAAVVWILEQVKRWEAFRWIQADTDRINRYVAFCAAFCGSLGLQGTMSGSFQEGGTLTITWPSLSQLGDAGLHVVAQAAMQELFYRGVVKKPKSDVSLAAPPSGGSALRREA